MDEIYIIMDKARKSGIFYPIASSDYPISPVYPEPSIGKINKLKKSLQKIRADISRFELENDENN